MGNTVEFQAFSPDLKQRMGTLNHITT